MAAFTTVYCQEIDTVRINGVPPSGLIISGSIAAGDIPVGTGGLPPLTDSGINVTAGAVSGAASYATAGTFLGPIPGPDVGQFIDLDTTAPLNQAVAFDKTTATMIVGAGISNTSDATLLLANASVDPTLPTVLTNTNGPTYVTGGTTAVVLGTVQTIVGEQTDGHFLILADTGAYLVAQNSLPLNLFGTPLNLGGITNLTIGDGGGNTVTFTRAAGAASYSLVFPATQGGAGETLRNDGSGNLSWGV